MIRSGELDRPTGNQLNRTVMCTIPNIEEGFGRLGNRDKSNFIIIARGSVVECMAIFDLIDDEN